MELLDVPELYVRYWVHLHHQEAKQLSRVDYDGLAYLFGWDESETEVDGVWYFLLIISDIRGI